MFPQSESISTQKVYNKLEKGYKDQRNLSDIAFDARILG